MTASLFLTTIISGLLNGPELLIFFSSNYTFCLSLQVFLFVSFFILRISCRYIQFLKVYFYLALFSSLVSLQWTIRIACVVYFMAVHSGNTNFNSWSLKTCWQVSWLWDWNVKKPREHREFVTQAIDRILLLGSCLFTLNLFAYVRKSISIFMSSMKFEPYIIYNFQC